MWSGGCDSTLSLLRLLKEKKRVRTISVIHPQIYAVAENAAARLAIHRRLFEMGHILDHVGEVVITTPTRRHIDIDGANNGGLIQPNIWLGIAASYLEQDEDLAFGYMRTDDFWHYKTEFNVAFKHFTKILAKESSELIFPLEWKNKAEIIKELLDNDLLKYCWTCETPTLYGFSCGNCTPCKHMIDACKEINIEFPFHLQEVKIDKIIEDSKLVEIMTISESEKVKESVNVLPCVNVAV